MGAIDNWDVTMLIVAGYLAVIALVRLMARHRDQLIEDLRQQFEAEKKRKQKSDELRESA